jgi:hypothetical protein
MKRKITVDIPEKLYVEMLRHTDINWDNVIAHGIKRHLEAEAVLERLEDLEKPEVKKHFKK